MYMPRQCLFMSRNPYAQPLPYSANLEPEMRVKSRRKSQQASRGATSKLDRCEYSVPFARKPASVAHDGRELLLILLLPPHTISHVPAKTAGLEASGCVDRPDMSRPDLQQFVPLTLISYCSTEAASNLKSGTRQMGAWR